MLSVVFWHPNAALNLTVCLPKGRVVTCEVVARVSHEQNASDKIRDNEIAEEHFQNLEWWSGRHWKRRVRAAERSFVHLGRFQAN